MALKEQVKGAGLELAAIENFDPAHWYDVLLGGPKREEHLQNIKTMIRNAGRAGIPGCGGQGTRCRVRLLLRSGHDAARSAV